MTNEMIKETADRLSDIFLRSEAEFERECARMHDVVRSVHDGYAIGKLCDVYRGAKTGAISRGEALERQARILEEAEMIFGTEGEECLRRRR